MAKKNSFFFTLFLADVQKATSKPEILSILEYQVLSKSKHFYKQLKHMTMRAFAKCLRMNLVDHPWNYIWLTRRWMLWKEHLSCQEREWITWSFFPRHITHSYWIMVQLQSHCGGLAHPARLSTSTVLHSTVRSLLEEWWQKDWWDQEGY